MKAVMISGTDLLITKREHDIVVGTHILTRKQAVELRNKLSAFTNELRQHEHILEKQNAVK